MKSVVTITLITTTALIASSAFSPQAEARSYAANAVNKVNYWAKYRYRSAYYVQSECYPTGYRSARCQVLITKARSQCSVNVSVTGRYYKIRPYDSSC